MLQPLHNYRLLSPLSIGLPGITMIGLKCNTYDQGGALVVCGVLKVEGQGWTESQPLSVNIPRAKRKPQGEEFYFKSWSEGEPIYRALLQAGFIKPTGETEPTGFVLAPLVTVNESMIQECEAAQLMGDEGEG